MPFEREDPRPHRIGFISTRFAGTDGVSLEAAKWAQVLEQDGHRCFWFAGELDRCGARSYLAPEAHFKHGQVAHIFGRSARDPEITEQIHDLRAILKHRLREFIHTFASDIEPLGFRFITMDGYLTPEVVKAARRILNGGDGRPADPERNYALARKYFSYGVLRQRLGAILDDLDGAAGPAFHRPPPIPQPQSCEEASIKLAV